MIHDVKDRDPRAGFVRRMQDPNLMYSDDILTEKSVMDENHKKRDTLIVDLSGARDPSHTGVNENASANDLDDKIKKLHEQLSSQ